MIVQSIIDDFRQALPILFLAGFAPGVLFQVVSWIYGKGWDSASIIMMKGEDE